ncbi:hypothetical protein D3C75_1307270 [compost metagenome]
MQRQITRRRSIHRRLGMRTDAVHALRIRQIFVARFAGDGERRLTVELRNDRTKLVQGSYDIIGKFVRGQHRPALGR